MKKFLLLSGLFMAILTLVPWSARSQYCIPVYKTGCSTGDSVIYFQLGAYTRTSGCSNFTHLKKTYKGYDSTGIVIPVFRGKNYPIIVANANTTQNFAVWIDYNQDGDFADSAEMVINDNNMTDSLKNQIFVPYAIKPGKYVLRMMDADSNLVNFLSPTSSCLTSGLNKGETEDYILQIKAPALDVALESLKSPSLYTCSGSTSGVTVVIRDQGTNSVSNIPVVLKLNGSTYTDTLKKTITMDGRDTFTFSSASISLAAGTYPFTVYTDMASDTDRTNDTLKGTITVGTTPTAPAGSSTSICAAGPASLVASTATKGAYVHWFASTTSDTDLYIGDTFKTPKITSKTTYYAESQILKADTIKTDTTLTSSSVRSNTGNMFDIIAKTDLQIDSFYVQYFSSVKDVVEVYYKEGTYVSYETKPKAWTFVGRDTVVGYGYSGGLVPAFIRFKTPFKAGHTYGIYVRVQTNTLAYDVGSKKFSNADMTLITGNSVAGKFGTPPNSGAYVTPRNWNGNVFYHVITCPSSRTPISVGIANLQAGFSYKNTCGGTVFTDTSKTSGAAAINSWSWDFGDSTTSKTQSPTHNYKYGGSKKIKLKVGFVGGCLDSITTTISANASPKAAFTFKNTCEGDSVRFTNTSSPIGASLSYSWDFGDLTSSSTATNPAHKYAATGKYTVRLITTYSGCSDTTRDSVIINAKPSVKFGYTVSCNNETVKFSDSSFVLGGGTYSWDFGDKSKLSTLASPSHTYSTFSSVSVKLKVTGNKNGCADSLTKTVNFLTGSKAQFTFKDSVCSGNTTTFTNTNVSAGAKYHWIFGDGANVNAKKDTTHTYAKGGSYPAMLVALNSNGCNDTMKKTVTIRQSPNAGFSISKVGFQKFTFIPTDSSGIKTFSWNYGDSSKFNTTRMKPTYSYKANIAHIVTFTALSTNGCSSASMDTTSVSTGLETEVMGISGIKINPNPFKESTTISYQLENAVNVTLEVYDMTGRKVARLASGNELAGSHSVTFDPTVYNVKAGVYMLRIFAGESLQSKQIIYVK